MDVNVPSPEGLQLRARPRTSARLNKKAVVFAIAAMALILGVVIVNVSKGKSAKAAEAAGTRELAPALNAAKDLTKDVPDFLAVPAPKPVEEPAPPPPPPLVHEPVKSSDDDARLADTPVPKFAKSEPVGSRPAAGAATEEGGGDWQSLGEGGSSGGGGVSGDTEAHTVAVAGRAGGGLVRVADQGPAADNDQNHQSDKLTFLEKSSQPRAYLNSRLEAPVSPFELKTGTVIPGVLISSISSDLPGEMIAQVAANVYDTATGKYLLIPQGSRLFGRYDSKVSFGQKRVLVSWQRLIFPNAATLELGGMTGHDAAGESGFSDQVDNHYGRIFAWALFTSVLSAGAQLSQPQESNYGQVPSSGQVAAASVGQQMAQLGAQVASRNLQVQPTLEIRKGYRLNVMVNRDIVFPGSFVP